MYILKSIQEDKLPAGKSHMTLTYLFSSWEFHKCEHRFRALVVVSKPTLLGYTFTNAWLPPGWPGAPWGFLLCFPYCVAHTSVPVCVFLCPSISQLWTHRFLSCPILSPFSCDSEELSGSPSLDLEFALTISCNFHFIYWILFSPNTLVEGGYFWPHLKEGWCPHSTDKNMRSLEVCIHALLNLIACSLIDAAINYTP